MKTNYVCTACARPAACLHKMRTRSLRSVLHCSPWVRGRDVTPHKWDPPRPSRGRPSFMIKLACVWMTQEDLRHSHPVRERSHRLTGNLGDVYSVAGTGALPYWDP